MVNSFNVNYNNYVAKETPNNKHSTSIAQKQFNLFNKNWTAK